MGLMMGQVVLPGYGKGQERQKVDIGPEYTVDMGKLPNTKAKNNGFSIGGWVLNRRGDSPAPPGEGEQTP